MPYTSNNLNDRKEISSSLAASPQELSNSKGILTISTIMMANEDIAILKQNLCYGNYLKCLPVKWDSVNGRVVVKSPRQQRHVIAMLMVHLLVTSCRLYSISLHPSNLINRSEAAFWALVYTVSFFLRFEISVDHGAVQIMNFLMNCNNFGTGELIRDANVQ